MRGLHILGLSIMTTKDFKAKKKEAYDDGETNLAILYKKNLLLFLRRIEEITKGLKK